MSEDVRVGLAVMVSQADDCMRRAEWVFYADWICWAYWVWGRGFG